MDGFWDSNFRMNDREWGFDTGHVQLAEVFSVNATTSGICSYGINGSQNRVLETVVIIITGLNNSPFLSNFGRNVGRNRTSGETLP